MHVKNNKNDICLFQETHKTGNSGIDFEDPVLKGWRVIHNGFKKKAQAGVAIVCAPYVTVEDEIFVQEGRIGGARVIVNGSKLSIFSCYSPTKFTLMRLKMYFTVPFQKPLKLFS